MTEYFTFKRAFSDSLISKEERASMLLSPIGYDEETNIFNMDDKTIGFMFLCTPMCGSDNNAFQQTVALLNDNYPPGSLLQFHLFRSPDLNDSLYKIKYLRRGFEHPFLNGIIQERISFIRGHTEEPIIIRREGVHNLGTTYDAKLYISFKMPIQESNPSDIEIDEAFSWQTKIITTLTSLRLAPRKATANDWLRITSTLYNWGTDASWRSDNIEWDKCEPLNNQVLDYDTDVHITREHIRIGKKYVKCLSSKRRPSHMYFGEAQHYAGDMLGLYGGLKTNYSVCVNVYYPPQDTEKIEIGRKRQMAVNAASGNFAKLAPVVKDKEADFNAIYESINRGHRPVQVSFHVIVFANSEKEVEEAATSARNHWRTHRFDIMVDKFIQMPIFINCIPLCTDTNAMVDLQRYKKISSEQAAPLIPLNGEWKGTGTNHLNLVTRNNQLMSISLDDSETNMNAVIAAESGAGKSVFANEIVTSYLSQGTRVWIIDVGYSYKKICEVYDGSYISFSSDSDICINPFQTIMSLDGKPETRDPSLSDEDAKNDDGQEDAIMGILMAMAAQEKKLDDYQVSQLRRILKTVWCRTFRDTTVDLIAAECIQDEDPRIVDIGKQLYPFTSEGNYGRFFNGKNNVKFDNQFIVLELEELKGRKHLQQVVLLQLIAQIQDTIYLGDRSRSVVIADEAWDLLSQETTAKFMEHAYRRFRKYGASMVIITQSINDLYNSTVGQAIAENSEFVFLLGQKETTIDLLQRSNRINFSEYELSIMKSVKTMKGVYSEIFVMSSRGRGVGRLVLSPFQNLLYSTNAVDVRAIKVYTDTGQTMVEAINQVLIDRRQT